MQSLMPEAEIVDYNENANDNLVTFLFSSLFVLQTRIQTPGIISSQMLSTASVSNSLSPIPGIN